MEIILLPETAQRIRATLEGEVDLSPAAVPSALSRLAVEAPAVYSQVLAELSGSQIRLDSERKLQHRHRRALLRRVFFWWGEYGSDVGDRLIAKRRVAAAVPFGIAGVILVLLGVSSTVAHRPLPTPMRAGVMHEMPAPGAHPESNPVSSLARSARVLRPAQARILAGALPILVPPPPLTESGSASGPFAPSISNRTLSTPSGNPIVFDRLQAPALTMPPGSQAAGAVVPPPVVYDRGVNESGIAFRDASDSSVDHPAALAQSQYHWVTGQRVAAHFATGVVVVVGGPPMPVIAESNAPEATWMGSATLGAEGLVQVTFTLASSGRPGGVRGVALDPDRLVPGLAGRMTLRHPNVAATVMAVALQAAGDYAQALARQGEATLGDGWAQLALGQAAPAWTYAAGRLAQVLDPHAGPGGLVETAEITGGSRLAILVTEAP